MGVIHEVRLPAARSESSRAERDALLARFAGQGHGEEDSLYFPSPDTAARATAEAARLGLLPERYYHFVVTADAIDEYPAYYLPVARVEPLSTGSPSTAILSDVDIAKDLDSERIWIRSVVRAVLEDYATGWTSTAVEGSDWHIITTWPEVPGPIWIPKPLTIAANDQPSGTYMVRSDGRDCLAAPDALFVQQHGLCVSHEVVTPDGACSVRPRHLIGPALLEEFDSRGIRGFVDALVPLIDGDTAVRLEGQTHA